MRGHSVLCRSWKWTRWLSACMLFQELEHLPWWPWLLVGPSLWLAITEMLHLGFLLPLLQCLVRVPTTPLQIQLHANVHPNDRWWFDSLCLCHPGGRLLLTSELLLLACCSPGSSETSWKTHVSESIEAEKQRQLILKFVEHFLFKYDQFWPQS